MIERLEEYIKNDDIYQEYKNGGTNFTDFDKFCIQHCKDIEELIEENEKLKIRNIHLKATIKDLKSTGGAIRGFQNYLDYKSRNEKAIEYIKRGYLVNTKDLLNILEEDKNK